MTAPRTDSAGLIIRQKELTNLETPFNLLDSHLTPGELFYRPYDCICGRSRW
jgi:hypothetical protein